MNVLQVSQLKQSLPCEGHGAHIGVERAAVCPVRVCEHSAQPRQAWGSHVAPRALRPANTAGTVLAYSTNANLQRRDADGCSHMYAGVLYTARRLKVSYTRGAYAALIARAAAL
jgi:hypothetical protein